MLGTLTMDGPKSPPEPDGQGCFECGLPAVCFLCDACPDHCVTDGGPDACWEAHEAWRLGKGDPTFGEAFASRAPKPGTVPAFPKPRWRS